MTLAISAISISGVKGVFDRSGQFSLSPKKGKAQSIAVFGRNGHGKSGYADAIEYMFSSDGEVEHLGKGSADSEQGGKHAIPHVLAKELDHPSSVTIEFTELETGKKTKISREVLTGRKDEIPAWINDVINQAPAHRVLRQHDLRRFVVDMAPGEKFVEFARWIGLESAAKLLNYVTTTERTLKDTDVDREIAEHERSIRSYTSGAITVFDGRAVVEWCKAEAKKHLTEEIKEDSDFDFGTSLKQLKAIREQILLGSPAAESFTNRQRLQNEAAGLTVVDGSLSKLESFLELALDAEITKNSAQNAASKQVFYEVWESACANIKTVEDSICPVCQTPWPETKVGSAHGAVVVLSESLGALQDFKTTSEKLMISKRQFSTALGNLHSNLSEISKLSNSLGFLNLEKESTAVRDACASLKNGTGSVAAVEQQTRDLLSACREIALTNIPKALEDFRIVGSPVAVTEIDDSITRLHGINEALSRLDTLSKQRSSIRAVEKQFVAIANKIRISTKEVAENAIDSLRYDVEEIYKKVHPGDAVPNVFIELNAERKTLVIRVSFHSDARRVPPGGYLSEAQINTLGLALFLSSVRLFNKNFPFVFLDDIVSSYDADNRARIVDVLAEFMNGFQIFLTTHDERFYTHLKQRLESENWSFEKISSYDFERGPKRETDNLRIPQITELIKSGDSRIAGNAVRQFIEEWFDRMCEKYLVHTLHRRDSREYQRTLFDFWQPFVERVSKHGTAGGRTILESIPYQRLKSNPMINYYSHYQANPYEWPAIGDVDYVWSEFQAFMGLFNCASCNKILKYDPTDKKLYCTCGGSIFDSTSPQKLDQC